MSQAASSLSPPLNVEALRCDGCGAPAALRSRLLGPVCEDCYEKSDEATWGGAYAVPLATIQRTRVRWLWPGRVPLGMLTLLIGDPGLGKSVLSLYLAAEVSKDGGGVLILSAEDDPGAVIRPRAEAAGADLDRLHVVGVRRNGVEDGFVLPDDAEDLSDLALDVRARLVIVDPLMAHLSDGVNSWRDQSVRRALAPLHRLAEQRGCAALVVGHLNKARGSAALYRSGGSVGIPAAARSALLLARDPDDPDGDLGGRRVLAHIKCNVAKQAESLACEVQEAQLGDESVVSLKFTGTSSITVADLLDSPTGEERTERDEAVDFLRAELADGPRAVKELKRSATEVGIAWRTIERAKSAVGVETRRVGGAAERGHWEWLLTPPSVYPSGGGVSKTRIDKPDTTGADPKTASNEDMAVLLGVEPYDDGGPQ